MDPREVSTMPALMAVVLDFDLEEDVDDPDDSFRLRKRYWTGSSTHEATNKRNIKILSKAAMTVRLDVCDRT